MKKLNPDFLYEDESYKLNGIFFKIHNQLGRFAKEKQYCNLLEEELKQGVIPYKRELRIGDTEDRPDFVVWDLIVVECKAKPFLQQEDFDQVQRYLHQTNLKLGILVNFRAKNLKPQRILKLEHRQVSVDSHKSADRNKKFMKAIIFCDGASKGNPGPAGWGAIVSYNQNVAELGDNAPRATNSQMELRAAIEAFEYARTVGVTEATVYCDSKYVIDGITKWIFGWQKNGWKTSTKADVANSDLWKRLHAAVQDSGIRAEWVNVGGHVGIPGNERADEIASDFAEGKKVHLYRGPLAGYKVDLSNINHDASLSAAKSALRDRAKLKAYSYVSEVDGEVKVHKTWAECEARVRGKKARYRKAVSPEEERQIIQVFSK